MYISGNASLDDLSKLPNAPKLDTLKKHSTAEDWAERRQQYRHQVSTRTHQAAATTEADVAARHVKIAQALQAKALQALQRLDVATLPASEVRQFLATATDIERKALGMDNRFTLRGVGDLDKLSDADLLTLARRAGVIGDDQAGALTA